MNEQKLWTKTFILSSVINFLMVMVFYMLVVVIASYAVHQLAATTAQAGLISGLFIVGTLVGRFFLNLIIQKFGQKPTMWIGLIGFVASAICYYVGPSITAFMLLRFLHGLSYGLASTVISTMVVECIPATRRGEGIGYFSLSNTVGTAIGPLLAIYLSVHTSFDWIFIFCIAVSVLCCLLSVFLKFPHLVEKQFLSEQHQASSWLNQMIDVKALPISLIAMLCAISYAGVLTFINFYAQQLQLVHAGTLFFLVYSFSIFLSRPFTGKLMDRKGENIVMYPALLCLSIGLALLAFAQSAVVLLLCAALLGFGFGNIQSIAQTIAIASTSIENIGLATSTFLVVVNVGMGFGPYVLGCLLNIMNYSNMYLCCAALAASCMGLYYYIHGRNAAIHRQNQFKRSHYPS